MLLAAVWLDVAKADASHQTPSIAESFDAFWAAADGRPFEEQEAIWDRVIEQPRQDVYVSVIWEKRNDPHWKELKERLLRARFAHYSSVKDQIATTARNLDSDMPIQVSRFRELFADAPAHPLVQLVLAPDFDAKSGLLGDGTPVLVFAVDTLVLERADMSVLFPHELFHLYHAKHAGIQNDGVMPGADLTLPLFAESLATYVSSVLSSGRSDGQLLLQSNLGALPVARLPQIAARFRADADQKAIDPIHPGESGRSAAFARWFSGSNVNYQPDLPNRSGYWLGFHLIRQMRRHFSLHELASWSPSKAQVQTRAALLELARGDRADSD